MATSQAANLTNWAVSANRFYDLNNNSNTNHLFVWHNKFIINIEINCNSYWFCIKAQKHNLLPAFRHQNHPPLDMSEEFWFSEQSIKIVSSIFALKYLPKYVQNITFTGQLYILVKAESMFFYFDRCCRYNVLYIKNYRQTIFFVLMSLFSVSETACKSPCQ